jgi:hypothetical protein
MIGGSFPQDSLQFMQIQRFAVILRCPAGVL